MTVSFCWPGIFFEQTNYMMIDTRKLPNRTRPDPLDWCWRRLLVLTCYWFSPSSVCSVTGTGAGFCFPDAENQSRKLLCQFFTGVTTLDSKCLFVLPFQLQHLTWNRSQSHCSPVLATLYNIIPRNPYLSISLWRIYTHGPMFDCSISPSWHKTVQFG